VIFNNFLTKGKNMKKLFSGFKLSHRLWIMNLGFFCIICLQGYRIVTVHNKDIYFARDEELGNLYQQPLTNLLHSVPLHAQIINEIQDGKSGRKQELNSIEAEVDAVIANLLAVVPTVETKLAITEHDLALLGKDSIKPQSIVSQWNAIKAKSLSFTKEENITKHQELVKSIRDSIAYIGETSAIILDPAADSYFLGFVSQTLLPQFQDRSAEVYGYLYELSKKPVWTNEDRQILASYASQLKSSDVNAIVGNTEAAFAADKANFGSSPTLTSIVMPPLQGFKNKAEIFVGKVEEFSLLEGPETVSFDEFSGLYEAAREQSFQLSNNIFKEFANLLDQRANYYSSEKTKDIMIVVFMTLLVELLSFMTQRSITKPLNSMIDSLDQGSRQVSTGVDELKSTSQSLAAGASEQAASLEEVASTMEGISTMAKHNSESAEQATNLSVEVQQVCERGKVSMEEMVNAITNIKGSADETAEIIKIIDDIAFQTNLLALNAAVEAARAGEAGKGFAVVAEEVRNLAQRSATAAKETASKIRRSKELADNGVKVSDRVSDSLREISIKSIKAADLVREIAAATKEQASGVGQVNVAVSELDKVTQSNAAAAEEMAAASNDLSSQSQRFNNVVSEMMRMVRGGKKIFHDAITTQYKHTSPYASTPENSYPSIQAVSRMPESAPRPTTSKKQDPNEFFPLDDNDFQGF
jgi:methyl-accepting chemotaxis protein